MLSPVLILMSWAVQLLICFYYVRSLADTRLRWARVLMPCAILTHLSTHGLPLLSMTSMLLTTYCWFATIRLIHWIVLSPHQFSTFPTFLRKFLWMFLPIVPCPAQHRQQWPIHYDFLSAGVKLVINHWIYRWLLTCPGSDSYARVLMFYTFVLSFTFLSDALSGVIRILSGGQYMHTTTINYPFLAHSLRDFWGRRYNQLVSAVFRESIFQPVRQYWSSTTIASLLVFLVSGLLHVHLAWVAVRDSHAALLAMLFFLLHGTACVLEVRAPFSAPWPLPWLCTQLFLLVTASLQIGPFIRRGPPFYALNSPIFFEQKWMPNLPVPKFCPK